MQQNATSSKLDIYIEDIQKGKHGSDSGSYDAEGRWAKGLTQPLLNKNSRCVDYPKLNKH